MPKMSAAERNRAITAQFEADLAVLDAAAPRLREILGFVPRDGLVSILAQSFGFDAAAFVQASDLVRHYANEESGYESGLDRAEEAFVVARDRLLAEIRRYQAAVAAVFTAALTAGNDKLADRALIAALDYGNYATHIGMTKVSV